MESDLQKVSEVIVGLYNTVLWELEPHPYLARAQNMPDQRLQPYGI